MNWDYNFGLFSYAASGQKQYGVVLEMIKKRGNLPLDIGMDALNIYRDHLRPNSVRLKDVRWFELRDNEIKEVLFGYDCGFFDPKTEPVFQALGEGVRSVYDKIKARKKRGVIYEIANLRR